MHLNENQLNEVINVETLKNHFQRPLDVLKEEFLKNLSIRTSGGIYLCIFKYAELFRSVGFLGTIENLVVNFEGQDYTLQELGQVVRKNPSMFVVNMSVFPQVIPTVIKTLQKSGMNLNPQQEGTTLYIPVPKYVWRKSLEMALYLLERPLDFLVIYLYFKHLIKYYRVTKEHRETLAKNAKQLYIKCRDNIKDVQMKHVKDLKKKQSMSEDVVAQTEQQILALADVYLNQAQTVYNNKCNELLNK